MTKIRPLKISVSGLPASGVTSIAEAISYEFKIDNFSIGKILRDEAQKINDASITSENKIALFQVRLLNQNDFSIDEKMNARIMRVAEIKEEFIIDSLMSWYILGNNPEVIRILVQSDNQTRIDRLAQKEGISKSVAEIRLFEREAVTRQRLSNFYHVNFDEVNNSQNYHFAIDTTNGVRIAMEKLKRKLELLGLIKD